MKNNSYNLINYSSMVKMLEDFHNEDKLNNLSYDFAYNEPNATLLIASEIEGKVQDIKKLKEDLSIATDVNNLSWHMFLIGYELGKQTHSYGLGGN